MAPKPKQTEPVARVFQIRADAVDAAGAPVTGISFGSAPHVHVAAGHPFSTSDERLQERLAAEPQLEEVTQP
jgi:hypothetical protein